MLIEEGLQLSFDIMNPAGRAGNDIKRYGVEHQQVGCTGPRRDRPLAAVIQPHRGVLSCARSSHLLAHVGDHGRRHRHRRQLGACALPLPPHVEVPDIPENARSPRGHPFRTAAIKPGSYRRRCQHRPSIARPPFRNAGQDRASKPSGTLGEPGAQPVQPSHSPARMLTSAADWERP